MPWPPDVRHYRKLLSTGSCSLAALGRPRPYLRALRRNACAQRGVAGDDSNRIRPKSDTVPGSLKITTKPTRIVVSDSKDLAYEFSTYNLVSDTKDGKHIDVNGAILRVWQKVGGEWKTASTFSRSYVE